MNIERKVNEHGDLEITLVPEYEDEGSLLAEIREHIAKGSALKIVSNMTEDGDGDPVVDVSIVISQRAK